MVDSINLVWISVNDFKKARKFFGETLGLKEESCGEEYGWAEFVCEKGGCRLGVARQDAQVPAGKNAVVTFTVESLDKSCQELKKKGVNFIGEVVEVPGHVRLQMITDPDGNLFQLVEVLG